MQPATHLFPKCIIHLDKAIYRQTVAVNYNVRRAKKNVFGFLHQFLFSKHLRHSHNTFFLVRVFLPKHQKQPTKKYTQTGIYSGVHLPLARAPWTQFRL